MSKGGQSKKPARVDAEPVFILHQYPYRETSLLLDVFSQSHGRFSLTARGARRAGSHLRGILMAFQPILLSWFGAGELKTLHSATWQGGVAHLSGLPLLCGFYMNELLMKLLPRDEEMPVLFTTYFKSISRLAKVNKKEEVEPILREFELTLLCELGYGFDVDCEYETGKSIVPEQNYRFIRGCGFVSQRDTDKIPVNDSILVSGHTLAALARRDFSCPKTRQQSKTLLREALGHELGGNKLHTRQILLDLHLFS